MYGIHARAQKDTIFQYLDSNRFECGKDTAVYLIKQYRQKGNWVQENYSVVGKVLNMVTRFRDKACDIPIGVSVAYSPDGTKLWTMEYENGSPIAKTFYYSSGAKKALMSFVYNIHKSWDEKGVEVPNTILAKDAKPVGFSWLRYLRDSINAGIAAAAKLPIGLYRVKASFVVDTSGTVTQVKAFSDKCVQCAKEVARVINGSPRWEPAMENNYAVPFAADAVLYFTVENRQANDVFGGIEIGKGIIRIISIF